jgi:hypothetical protein
VVCRGVDSEGGGLGWGAWSSGKSVRLFRMFDNLRVLDLVSSGQCGGSWRWSLAYQSPIQARGHVDVVFFTFVGGVSGLLLPQSFLGSGGEGLSSLVERVTAETYIIN